MKLNYKLIAISLFFIFAIAAAYQKGMIDSRTGNELELVATAEAKKKEYQGAFRVVTDKTLSQAQYLLSWDRNT